MRPDSLPSIQGSSGAPRRSEGEIAGTPIFRLSWRFSRGRVVAAASYARHRPFDARRLLSWGISSVAGSVVRGFVSHGRGRLAPVRLSHAFRRSRCWRLWRRRSALFAPSLYSERIRFQAGSLLRADDAVGDHWSGAGPVLGRRAYVWPSRDHHPTSWFANRAVVVSAGTLFKSCLTFRSCCSTLLKAGSDGLLKFDESRVAQSAISRVGARHHHQSARHEIISRGRFQSRAHARGLFWFWLSSLQRATGNVVSETQELASRSERNPSLVRRGV